MDVDWAAEDSASSGSGCSPKTAASGETKADVSLSDADWRIPPFLNTLSKGLELFDPTGDDMTAAFPAPFPRADLSAESTFGFDSFPDYGAPQSSALDATSNAMLDDFSTSSFERRGAAFDQLGTNDDGPIRSTSFASPASESDLSLDMSAWADPALFNANPVTSACIQPSELFVKSEIPIAPELLPSLAPTLPPAHFPSTTSAPTAMPDVTMSEAPTAFVPKARSKKAKPRVLPPLGAPTGSPLSVMVLGLKSAGLRPGSTSRLYTTRAETAQRIQLVLVSGVTQEDLGGIESYTDEAGVLYEEQADQMQRSTAYRYMKLDKSSPIFKRNHKTTPPEETIYLETHVYCGSQPDEPVKAARPDAKCLQRGGDKGCIARERKRWIDRVLGSRRTYSDAREDLIQGSIDEINVVFDEWCTHSEAIFYNEAEIVEINEGCASVQLRLLHYARCCNETEGYFVTFVLRDYLGRVIASTSTPNIFVTDDHKAPNTRISTSTLPSPVNSSVEELSATSSRGSRRSLTSSRAAAAPALTASATKAPRRTSSGDSDGSSSVTGKRASDHGASATAAKRRRGSGFVSRSSLSMTPRDPGLSNTGSPTQRSRLLSEPVSFEAVSNRLEATHRGPASPGSETTSSSMRSPITAQSDLLASLHRAEQNAPLAISQRIRSTQPRIEDVIPMQGPLRGGSRIAVIGTGFRQNSTVYFGLTPSQTDFRGSTSLICTLPPGTTAGPVNVHFGIETANDPAFTYVDETETTLTVQGVSLIAATLGLTALDLTKRFDELRKTGQFGNGANVLTSSMSGAAPSKLVMSVRRERRASIGEQSSRNGSSADLTAQSRAKSMTDLAGDMGPLTPPPHPPRRLNTSPKKQSAESMLLSLFDLPDKRMPASAYAENVRRGCTTEGHTVLHLAAILGMHRLVQLFVDRGVFLNLADVNGLTALHFAALHGRTSVIRLLLQAGAATESRTSDGMTAFMLARDHESEDVAAAFPVRARVASRASSMSSVGSYFASGSSLGEYSSEEVSDEDQEEEAPYTDEEEAEEEDEKDDFIARPISLTASALRSRAHVLRSPRSCTSEEEATVTMSDFGSVSTARPTTNSKGSWFNGLVGEGENNFWTPISTAWWQPRRAAVPPREKEGEGPPPIRMYKPSEATELAEKAAPKMHKMQAALSRRLGYTPTTPPPNPRTELGNEDEDDVDFHLVKKHRTLWHDRKLFLIWLPAMLLAFAYFLHSAALLPDLRFILLPARMLRMVLDV